MRYEDDWLGEVLVEPIEPVTLAPVDAEAIVIVPSA